MAHQYKRRYPTSVDFRNQRDSISTEDYGKDHYAENDVYEGEVYEEYAAEAAPRYAEKQQEQNTYQVGIFDPETGAQYFGYYDEYGQYVPAEYDPAYYGTADGYAPPADVYIPATLPRGRKSSIESLKKPTHDTWISPESSLNHLKADDEFLSDRSKRFDYGCIPRGRKARVICFSVVFTILAILGVLIFLFFPRIPEFRVLGIEVKNPDSFKISPIDQSADIINFSFEMDMEMSITVKNTNYYRLKIDLIALRASLNANGTLINDASPSPAENIFSRTADPRIFVDASNYKVPIGRGNYTDLNLPPNVDVKFTLPFQIRYSTDPKIGALNDPAFNELIQLCLENNELSPTENRTTVISYNAVNTIGAVAWLGYQPTIDNTLNINCPLTAEPKAKFIKAVSGT